MSASSLSITCPPDVDVTKTADSAVVNGGAAVGFTITITNEGATTATGVTMTDALPAGMGNDIVWTMNSNPSGKFVLNGTTAGSQTLTLVSGLSLTAGQTITAYVDFAVATRGRAGFDAAPIQIHVAAFSLNA